MIIDREALHTSLDAILDAIENGAGKYGITMEVTPFCINVRAAKAGSDIWDYYEDFRNGFCQAEFGRVLDIIDELKADTSKN